MPVHWHILWQCWKKNSLRGSMFLFIEKGTALVLEGLNSNNHFFPFTDFKHWGHDSSKFNFLQIFTCWCIFWRRNVIYWKQNYKQLSSGNKMEVYRVKIVLKDCRFYCDCITAWNCWTIGNCGDKTVLRIIIINV